MDQITTACSHYLWLTWVNILQNYHDQAYISFIEFGLDDKLASQSATYFVITIRKKAIQIFEKWVSEFYLVLVKYHEIYNDQSVDPQKRILVDNLGKLIFQHCKIFEFQIKNHEEIIQESKESLANMQYNHLVDRYIIDHINSINMIQPQINDMIKQSVDVYCR